jgi:hypothetical protein
VAAQDGRHDEADDDDEGHHQRDQRPDSLPAAEADTASTNSAISTSMGRVRSRSWMLSWVA